jgi:phenylalanyl-tRNA synthetase beta chain
MKVLLSWLREFAPIEGDPVELGNHMSDLGMAVEEMTIIEPLPGIVVARVLDLRPHPQADRIQLVDVDPGTGESLQVCCGAFNMSVGDHIPFATIGTVMPNGMEIAKRKMRGEDSNGMCCSAAEIGLGSDHDGIMVLPDSLELGSPLMDQLGLAGDVLYDLEINPNRPDAMSVAGVARDLAARLGVPFAMPEWSVSSTDEAIDGVASVEIVDGDLCGRFAARVLRGVQVGESPLWMQMRLTLLGMRPINSVVDVSNYVMLELGTPNHTYDLAKVPGGRLGVRRARGPETLVTLDDQERELVAGDGLIVNSDDEPIGIAGVMGGASTEISDSTDAVLLEMAWWKRESIARTSQRLGLRSEASARFERGTDWALKVAAVDRFCLLLDEITPGGVQVAAGTIDARGDMPASITVPVRTARMSHLLGREFTSDEVRSLLEPIGFGVEATSEADVQDVTIPSFRPDTETETDIAEEVARHYGYGWLGTTVPRSPDAGHLSSRQKLRRSLRQVLVGLGLSEAMPNPFLAPGAVAKAGLPIDNPVRLLNPLAVEESVLRPSLLPGLVDAVAYNESHRNASAALFEIGATFRPPIEGSIMPDEHEYLGVIVAGSDALAAKQLWDSVATGMGVDFELVNADDLPGMHPTRAAEIVVGGDSIGVVAEIDPGVLEAHGVSERCAWIEVRVGPFLAAAEAAGDRPYRLVSTYPSSDIDLAFVVDETTQASAIEATLREAGGAELISLSLFDVYRGDQLGEGKRSLAYALRLQAADRTMTDDEMGEIRQRCIDAVQAAHPATLRG